MVSVDVTLKIQRKTSVIHLLDHLRKNYCEKACKTNYYIFSSILLVIIFLFILVTIFYYCIKHWLKQKCDEKEWIDIKNGICYCFDDTTNINGLDLDNILLNKKSYGDISAFSTAYKTPYYVKPLHVIFDKLDRHIGKYERDKYLILFPSDEKYKSLLDRIRYFIMLK